MAVESSGMTGVVDVGASVSGEDVFSSLASDRDRTLSTLARAEASAPAASVEPTLDERGAGDCSLGLSVA